MSELDEIRVMIKELQDEVKLLKQKHRIAKKTPVGELTGIAKLAHEAVKRGMFPEGLDLISTKRFIFLLRKEFPDKDVMSASVIPREFNRAMRSVSMSLSRVPGINSLRTTVYARGDHIEKGRQINSTTWCIRNLEKYQAMTPSELGAEEETQWNLAVHGESNPEPIPVSQAPLTFF